MLWSGGTPLCTVFLIRLSHKPWRQMCEHTNASHWARDGQCCRAVRDLTFDSLLQMLLLLMLTLHRAYSNSERQPQIWQRGEGSYSLQRSCHSQGNAGKKNTHSSVSPGILSLSRWAFMAELCSFALLWSWYAFTLPACPPSGPLQWQRAKTQPLQSS